MHSQIMTLKDLLNLITRPWSAGLDPEIFPKLSFARDHIRVHARPERLQMGHRLSDFGSESCLGSGRGIAGWRLSGSGIGEHSTTRQTNDYQHPETGGPEVSHVGQTQRNQMDEKSQK